MNNSCACSDLQKDAQSFVGMMGEPRWKDRIAHLQARSTGGRHYGRLMAQRNAVEFSIEKARRGLSLSPFEATLAARAAALLNLLSELSPVGRVRFEAVLATAMDGDATLVPLLHLHDTASQHEAMGFAVRHDGFENGSPFDLLITRDGVAAEVACDTFSAETGHLVHRGAWMRLVDRINPDLQTWLSAHPGRYLLKVTLPKGLRDSGTGGTSALAALHRQINAMLSSARRTDHDEAAILRLDPLILAATQADENGLLKHLRSEFGPEANLAVTGDGRAVLVLAARASNEDEVAVAMRKHLVTLAPTRLSGTRPGILALFIDDTDRLEWGLLRERLVLEGEARQFLTVPEARPVVAVTCTSRIELSARANPADVMRFCNPSHPNGKFPALAPAVLSTC